MSKVFDVNMAWNAAKMFEGYFDLLKNEHESRKVYSLKPEDMELWKTVYYPAILNCGEISDASFFEEEGRQVPNYGVGADGEFLRYEYCNILYQLYHFVFWKKLGTRSFDEIIEKNTELQPFAMAFQLLQCLEEHVEPLKGKGTGDQALYRLEGKELEAWNVFYQWNSQARMIPDGEFFGDDAVDPNLGIGKDGAYYGVELLHFLYQVYKILCKLL